MTCASLLCRNELVTFICDALEHLERENYINRMAGVQTPGIQAEDQPASEEQS
jgi:hypothetical protein